MLSDSLAHSKYELRVVWVLRQLSCEDIVLLRVAGLNSGVSLIRFKYYQMTIC